MNIAIVGYTGFVGSNLCCSFQFDARYNSKNIEDAYGTKPDLLIYAGVTAEKYLANNKPDTDRKNVMQALTNIKKIEPKQIVLISTIDVYERPHNVDENSEMNNSNLQPYGYNRFDLENEVRKYNENTLIVRLPGLFGENIKKNYIYDFINNIPFRLSQKMFNELKRKDPLLFDFYLLNKNGFYQCKPTENIEKNILKKHFIALGFSALNFTDSRSIFQFYNLNHLWNHIKVALEHNLKLINMATEPIQISELHYYLTGAEFKNHLGEEPQNYGVKTCHDAYYNGENGYLMSKERVMEEIKFFINNQLTEH